MTNIAVLIMAAGTGARFGGNTPKQYAPLLGRRVINWSIDLFQAHPKIGAIYVVTSSEDTTEFPHPTLTGGATRQESVRKALAQITKTPDIVLIHDAARPCLTKEMLDRVIESCVHNRSAIPVLPVVDTLRKIEPNGHSTIQPRDYLHATQTPQAFQFKDIFELHQKYAHENVTDDAALYELDKRTLSFCAGDPDNIKITHAHDLTRAEMILSQRRGDIRIGKGFDVHRLIPATPERPLMLGGLAIAHEMTLDGHSDADVLLHAITDAILGAITEGDIGLHFPPSDPRWKNASSDQFLKHAAQLVRNKGGIISHIDTMIMCEAPKISPHRDAIRQKIADILSLPINRISIKATTTEGLGFTGRKEGIAAEAVATLRLPFSTHQEV